MAMAATAATAVTALLPMVLQALQSMPTTSLLLTKTQAAATTAMALMPKGMMMTLLQEMILMVKVQWCLKQWLAETVTLRDPTSSGMH
jgi:hypothetical protein